jgi:hypothetical protein
LWIIKQRQYSKSTITKSITIRINCHRSLRERGLRRSSLQTFILRARCWYLLEELPKLQRGLKISKTPRGSDNRKRFILFTRFVKWI